MNFLTGTSNADYHADKTHLSSSGLKLLLQDPAQFYQEYVLGQRKFKVSAAMDEGTLVHALILEPHTVAETFAVWTGIKRTGALYKSFQVQNPDKLIVTSAMMKRARALANACRKDPTANGLLINGHPEFSMVSKIDGVSVKSRADYICLAPPAMRPYIVDVKTTSRETGPEMFAETIQQFAYDLSAALYAQIAENCFQQAFDFYWIVLSKADMGVTVVKASSEDMRIGHAKVRQALSIYKQCKETGIWKLPETPTPNVNKGVRMSVTFKTSKGTELPTMNLKGKPYLQVAHRFVALNDDVPRFNIRTTFLKIDSDETVCQAEVVLCSEIGEALKVATATKRETKKDFPDHTEKAETGAIGRALAMLGFGTQFATQDMDEGDRLADAPVTPAKKPAKKAANDEF